jgi:5'-deoxynucleotidase YfbR-like HD superfamily hydrolase
MFPSPLALLFAIRHHLLSQRQTIPHLGGNIHCKWRELSVQTHIFSSALAALFFGDSGAIRNLS